MDVKEFKKRPVLGILRGITPDMAGPVIETSVSAGLKAIEVTMNTEGAPEIIQKMNHFSGGRLFVGAGTVLTMEELHACLEAGASFIVSPVLVKEVAAYCRTHDIPYFPGAFSPQEIYDAWLAGAAMVKVFPAGKLGPSYFKDIKGPFNDIELLACGGVNEKTAQSFFDNKASAVAFGGGIFKSEWLKDNRYDKIEESIKALLNSITI